MPVSTSIDVSFAVSGSRDAFLVELFESLLDECWSIPTPCTHLPLGDIDSFDWTDGSLTRSEVLDLIAAKHRVGEKPGIVLAESESGRGAMFLYLGEGNLSINPAYDRLTLEASSRTTDFSWYLERLLPPMNRLETGSVESITMSHFD